MLSIYKPVEDLDPAMRVTLMMLAHDAEAAGYEEVSVTVRFRDGNRQRLLYFIEGEWMEGR